MIIRQIPASTAGAALDFAGCFDPENRQSNQQISSAGFCVEYVGEKGNVVCVMRRMNNSLWITGAGATRSNRITQTGLPLVEKFARDCGLKKVKFQTGRKGLVRVAQKLGYIVVSTIGTGFLLEKTL